MDLRGKVALITGGASGHGREFCKELIKQGCKVSICDINMESGDDLLHQLCKMGGKDRVMFCLCDITDYMQFEEAFQTTITKFGTIDIVINGACVMNDRLWELEVDVNLNGVIRGLLLAFRFLGRDRGGAGGVVLNLGAGCIAAPFISLPVFTATKLAVAALTRTYGDAYHVAVSGVRVVGLCAAPPPSVLGEGQQQPRKRILSADYERAWQRDVASTPAASADSVARALVEILQKAPSGSSWLVDDARPPREITVFPP